MEETHAEAMLSALVSNECALGSDVVPMVFGNLFVIHSVGRIYLALAPTASRTTESRNHTQCPSYKTSFADALAFAFVGFRKATRVLG